MELFVLIVFIVVIACVITTCYVVLWMDIRPIIKCNDCGVEYANEAWIEAVVPNAIWKQISPTKNEGGILCITCMAQRCVDAGLKDIPIKITAGPFLLEKNE